MKLLDRLSTVFGDGTKHTETDAERALVADTVEAIVEAVEPRLRMQSSYRYKLEPCVRKSIAHVRAIGREGLEPITLNRAAWASDPRVNAFFATRDDVPAILARSTELRRFFDSPANASATEAYAVLGMKKEERSVLGMDLKGDAVQREVAQTVVNFSGHRIVAPSASLAETRLETGRRIMLRLAQVALTRVIGTETRAGELHQHKAYLGARLRLLRLAKDGMEGIVKDPATINAEMQTVERELEQTVDDYIETKGSLATLDGYISHIDAVFSHPEQHVSLTRTPLRISQMGVRVEGEAAGPVNELSLTELTIGANFRAAIAIVICPRSEMPSKEELIARAEHTL